MVGGQQQPNFFLGAPQTEPRVRCWFLPQSTYTIYLLPRVPRCLFPRPNWDPPPPNPSPPSECVPPQNQGGGTHSPAAGGAGVPIRKLETKNPSTVYSAVPPIPLPPWFHCNHKISNRIPFKRSSEYTVDQIRSLLHACKEKSPEITVGGFGYKHRYAWMFVSGW